MTIRIYIVDAYESHRKVVINFLAKLRPDVEVDLHDMTRPGLPADDFDWSRYNLLVMDSRLGKLNGLDWLSQLKDKPGFPPVIYLSSENSVDVAVQAMKSGAVDFLPKKGMNPARLKQVFSDILPVKPMADILPDMKPLPAHYETQQYSAADTQILSPEAMRGEVDPRPDTEPEPQSIDDEEYWMEQTQILHVPK